jgi:hypothetical protein
MVALLHSDRSKATMLTTTAHRDDQRQTISDTGGRN